MSLDEKIANLIRIGTLKRAARDEAQIRQYVTNAEELKADADRSAFALSRFLLAYDGLYALAMAFLTIAASALTVKAIVLWPCNSP